MPPLHLRSPHSPYAFVGTYADDTSIAVRARDSQQVQTSFQTDLLMAYLTSRKIVINPQKCITVFFSKRRSTILRPVEIHDKQLNYSPSASYLGVHMVWKLNWSSHTPHTSTKIRFTTRQLYPIHSELSVIHLRINRRIYPSVVRPQIRGSSSSGPHHT